MSDSADWAHDFQNIQMAVGPNKNHKAFPANSRSTWIYLTNTSYVEASQSWFVINEAERIIVRNWLRGVATNKARGLPPPKVFLCSCKMYRKRDQELRRRSCIRPTRQGVRELN
ncbi:hypothetical protein RRG08_063430 [Elysia crispata]|uniref:Uncharacterized protein n=1 Tax=Elysia crispata TaxID=231223 RepID=A0AAE1AA17_9GAST|nr:hypothetical protein RRG08_063430 [Elysia crispata]